MLWRSVWGLSMGKWARHVLFGLGTSEGEGMPTRVRGGLVGFSLRVVMLWYIMSCRVMRDA